MRGFVSKLVWHEIGHLCISLLLTKQNENYDITKIGFTFSAKSRSWRCFVTCKNEAITDDEILIHERYHEECCLTILNNFAGAIFEGAYWRLFEGNYIKPIEILAKGSAINDCLSLRKLLETYSKKNKDELRDKLVTELLPTFFEIVITNHNFTNAISNICERYVEQIILTFNDKEDFELNFNEEEIQSLSTEVQSVLDSSGLEDKIVILKNSVSKIILNI